ncbi:MAG: peptidoglycan bridge formation glycyltransferase FemA/FemB family protein [Patescibacteria group bacterium]
MIKEHWDNLVEKHNGEFLQSWEWGEFQESLGRQVIRFFDKELGLGQIVVSRIPFGLAKAYIPRGPIFFDIKPAELVNKIIELLPPNVVFCSLEPTQFVPGIAFDVRQAKQPIQTAILNLSESEEELLAAMHSKTRYSIRIGLKSDLMFSEINADEFYKLLSATAHRQKFRTYPKEYFVKLEQTINKSHLKFLGVFKDTRLVAAGVFYTFGSTATYLHGGSDYQHRALMGPHLLHWGAIKLFKSIGCGYYDFWGIDKEKWPGITRFKMGFGGEVKKYPGAYVKILKPWWYRLYRLVKK